MSAEDNIAAQYQATQDAYAAWFPEDASDSDRVAILALATEHGFKPDPRDSDETDDDYADRIDQDAANYVTDKRDEHNALNEEIAGFELSVTVQVRMEISGGGPAEYLTADLDPDLSNVIYHYTEWGSHAERRVPEGSPLYRVLERFTSVYENMNMDQIIKAADQ